MRGPAMVMTAGLVLAACDGDTQLAALTYECGNTAPAASERCGAGDPNLPPEPTLPTDVCQTLVATKTGPEEDANTPLDTQRIQDALSGCAGRAVRLVADGANNSFIAAHLTVSGVTLWIDSGVTLYTSRNAELFQKTGNCGVIGVNDSGACNDFITIGGASPGIVGDGVIDGQGDQPLVGHDYSWWQMSAALRDIDGSIGNPTLLNVGTGTTGLLLYRITLHNSPKFHVKLSSSPPGLDKTCTSPGKGFIVWGVTILTPSRWKNSQGLPLTPLSARNTDGIDPGANDIARCGVIACSTISTSDDQIAIKGGHYVADLVIAHNHFGTGHGMSIGSETYGDKTPAPDPEPHAAVERVKVYDLTIDADSRAVGFGADAADSNGIRVKSDPSRGGSVKDISFSDVCMRDMSNAILISTSYNPLFAGNSIPRFGALEFHDVHHVTCMEQTQPVVTLNGFSAAVRAGPITLDNVIIDNIGPPAVWAQFSDFVLGPGPVNFTPAGLQVSVTNQISNANEPKRCVFPKLPTPDRPEGWLW